MSQLFSLSAEQLERIKPFFPLSHGISRVDDLKVISGIIYVIKHGLQWIASGDPNAYSERVQPRSTSCHDAEKDRYLGRLSDERQQEIEAKSLS